MLVGDHSKSVAGTPTRPTHVLIQGDNHQALKVLACTHERAVDVIYIDPPYNTGNKDFKYNDRFVDKEDGYRHSKWLSFMAKRLKLGRALLKDDGLVFVSIDEHEYAQLTLLGDEIFGESNRVETFVWLKNVGKNDTLTTRTLHEYVLCWARNIELVKKQGQMFRIEKPGYAEVVKIIERSKKQGLSAQEAQVALRAFYKSSPELKGVAAYNQVDAEEYSKEGRLGVYRSADLSWPGKGGPRYEILHPLTGRACSLPKTGWGLVETSMQRLIAAGGVLFGPTEATVPSRKNWLQGRNEEAARSVLQDAGLGIRELDDILGNKVFNGPKPTNLIRQLISFSGKTSAVVLDFFAGSGTTGHAVMQLNAEDGGNRRCILVTNDEGEFKDSEGSLLEGGICTHVTHPRLRRVIEGYTTPSGKEVRGLLESLAFYRADFAAVPATHGQHRKFFEALVDTFRLKEGCFDEVKIEDSRWRLFTNNRGHHLVVLLDEFASEECAVEVARLEGKVKVYAFSYYEDDDVSDAFAHLENVEVVAQPGRLLKALKKVHTPKQKV